MATVGTGTAVTTATAATAATAGTSDVTSAVNALQRLIELNATTTTAVVPVTDLSPTILTKYNDTGNTAMQLAQVIYDSSYINKGLTNETARVGALSSSSRTNIYKIRQMTLADSYNANYYRFVMNIIIFTCFITMACLAVGAALRADVIKSLGIAFAIIFVILVFYALAMMFVFNSVRSRTKSDWNQFYFQPSDKVVNAK